MNALSDPDVEELNAVFDELEAQIEICVAIITGGGTRSFAAGADIKGFKERLGDRDAAFKHSRSNQTVFSKILMPRGAPRRHENRLFMSL